jgi:hypothetical protein
MGLKEEMTADLDPQVHAKAETRKTVTKRVDVSVHQHGTGKCEEMWVDEDGRRRVRPAQGRVPKYAFNCKVCKTEDAKRMAAAPTLTDEDIEHTVFLVPERAYDQRVAREYLAKRYPGRELFMTADIRPARLAMHKSSKIVVVTRRALPGNSSVGAEVKKTEDRHGSTIDVPVDPAEYVSEVVESAPVDVSECVSAAQGTMFSDSVVDLSELNAHLCDLALPGYFVAQYKRVVGSDELVFTLRSLTH